MYIQIQVKSYIDLARIEQNYSDYALPQADPAVMISSMENIKIHVKNS